jgi:uncharacterized protein (TIGR02680 family)
VNLYRYDYEEFWYEDGHLLLRGNNGTGKSRVLALQLPFLLDGDISPHRLEPDGDISKKIEWNLLLGNKYSDRLGYTWIEFGRIDSDGHEHFVTLGCGLHAAEHRGLVAKWFFVTNQRIGLDVFLLSSQRIPLTKERLSLAIGDRGAIYTTAGEYRKAVDQILFQLGDRYYPLVNLLVQLRQPQLSRHLDEKLLSRVLSEALPPLSEQIITDVADSFRSLDDDQSALASLRAARAGVDTFLQEYRGYLQIAALRRGASVRSAQAAYDNTRDALRETRELLRHTEDELGIANATIADLEVEEQARTAALKALSDSPEMQDARTLEKAQQHALDRKNGAAAAETDHKNAIARRSELSDQVKANHESAFQTLSQVKECASRAVIRSSETGIDTRIVSTVELSYNERLHDKIFQTSSKKLWEEATQGRLLASQHLRRLNSELQKARDVLENAITTKSLAEGDVNSAVERRHSAYDDHRHETELFADAFRLWANSVVELEIVNSDDLFDSIHVWSERAEGAAPARLAAETAFAAVTKRVSELMAQLERNREDVALVIEKLEDEQRSLRDGIHIPPPAPHTRVLNVRENKEGAPLWLLVDFAENVPPSARAGIEAALEASGFLDSWVAPNGTLLDGENDTILLPSKTSAGTYQRLDMVLKPSIDRTDLRTATLDEDLVAAILHSIPVGKSAGEIWFDADGTWQTGPLRGSWTKSEPQHIGQSARAASRRKRLAEIEAELSRHKDALRELQQKGADIGSRQRLAESELQRLPDDSGVRNAIALVTQAAVALEASRHRLADAEARVARQRTECKALSDKRDNAAADVKLDQWIEDLNGFEAKVHELRTALAGFWPNVQSYSNAKVSQQRSENMFAEAKREEDRRAAAFHDARQAAAAAEAEFEVLQSSIGASVKQILEKIETVKHDLQNVQERLEAAERKSGDLRVDAATQSKDVDRFEADFETATTSRDSACKKLQKLSAARLLQIVLPGLEATEIPWSATRAVEIARSLANTFPNMDASDSAWDASEKDIHHHIQTLIEALQPHGHRPLYSPEDGVVSVVVYVQGKEWTMADLRYDLDVQIRDRQRILDEREIEILERHLIGEVSSHLHDLLHQAMELVERMNGEIESRPMSTGMALRFKWELDEDAPDGLDEIRALLLRKDGTWSMGDRQRLGHFLQQQIKSVREDYESGTWADHLKFALDYRTWHRFIVERQQDGRWQRLTRRTHGTGSGGEKAVALTIPQFAAAAAHYQSASPFAPRLILLDEAFVGIDNDMRSKCMGLLAAFDLDFIMTSEREWGCYATLPGLAIYQLSSRQGLDGVGITRWIWNGRQRIQGDKVLFDTASVPQTQT